MNSYIYVREQVVIYVFLVGVILFAQRQKRKQKGKKKKNVGICPILFWAKNFKTKKNGQKFIECSFYIYFLNKT